MSLDISQARATDMENAFDETEIAAKSTEGIANQDETTYTNSEWSTYWGYFNEHPELKSAILMKAIWDVGKGYACSPEVSVILGHIIGWGKDTFGDILFNMDVVRYIGRDSIAEIMRSDNGTLINLKPLDPASIRWVVNRKGQIIRYEQFNKLSKEHETIHKFKPEEIFHLSNNRLADQIHGISVIESLDKTILAEVESFVDMKKIMHRQARPFLIFKWKTDDLAKIEAMKTRIDALRNLGEDLHLPDDESVLTWDVVQADVSQIVLAWRQDINNKFYRALGMPLIIFGAQGSTESGGKMEYFAHEQVFEHGQKYLENQIWNQLGLRINLIPPTSMAGMLQTDQNKDMSATGLPQGLEMQPSDVTAGVGK